MRFAKAHGLGNDFLLVDARAVRSDIQTLATRLCERHTGVGADGVIVYDRLPEGVSMRLWNADGSEAEISGNGLRCLAAYAFAQEWQPALAIVRTAAGPRGVAVEPLGTGRFRVRCDLGRPILHSGAIPILVDPPREPVTRHQLWTVEGVVTVTATSLGNPHCAVFLDTLASDALVARLGPVLEHHPAFPRRTNVELVTVLSRHELRVRFWERGVGPTRASGTGAASAVVAAVLEGRVERGARVTCDGGVLDVEWGEDGVVRQTGEVEVVFEAEWAAD